MTPEQIAELEQLIAAAKRDLANAIQADLEKTQATITRLREALRPFALENPQWDWVLSDKQLNAMRHASRVWRDTDPEAQHERRGAGDAGQRRCGVTFQFGLTLKKI